MKTGDIVNTPDGEGCITNFEINPPLQTRSPVYYTTEIYSEEQPPGTYIRVGVKDTRHKLSIAYYPLKTILSLNS